MKPTNAAELMKLMDTVYTVFGRRFPRCRDCADDGPVCPNSGLPCDLKTPFDQIQKAIKDQEYHASQVGENVRLINRVLELERRRPIDG